MKKIFIIFLMIVFTLSIAGCSNSKTTEENNDMVSSPVAGKKVAYIMQMAPSDIFQMWSESAKKQRKV